MCLGKIDPARSPDPALWSKKKLEKKSPLLCQILGTNCVVLWSFFAPVKPRLVSAIFGNYYYYFFFFSASSEAVTAFNQSGANELFSARPALNLHSRSSAEKWKVTDKWPPRSTSLSSRFSSWTNGLQFWSRQQPFFQPLECARAVMLYEIISVAHHQSPCGVFICPGKSQGRWNREKKTIPFL